MDTSIRELTDASGETLPDNVRFFQSLGFRIFEEATHPGFDAPTSCNMAKPIPPSV